MSAQYDLYETPNPDNTEEQKPLHARIVPSGTYSKKEFLERASRSSQTFNYNVIDAVVGVVIDELAEALSEGYTVELGELGYFSISLKCTHKVMNKRDIRAESICFDNVHLRTSKEFKRKIRREMELERVEKSKHAPRKVEFSIEQRQQMLQEFLKSNGGITRLEYSRLTGLSRLKAIDDLNAFIKNGILRKRGAGRTVFYVWKQEE
ncbi:HU family DNA-binding protein [Bacteroides sp.]|uniref:HU family DNA-binding protein n=1 Tax=Bacteroides sp. TaxID=29523 RepID=UPI0025B91EA0|nr:DNA-binding protein [Bacteroides sp.]